MRIAKIGFLTAAVSLLLVAPTIAWAETKPILLVSISSIQDLINDAGHLTSLAGQDGMGGMVGGMMEGNTEGLDPTRPLGLAVTTDGTDFRPLVVLPVRDWDAFIKALPEQIGKPVDSGDGVWEMIVGGLIPVYMKHEGQWAFASQTIEGLEGLPSDPAKLLGGMNARYHIGIRAYMANIPTAYREMFLSKVKEGIEMQLELTGDPDAADEQREMLQAQIRQYEVMLNEVDQLTIGIKVDSPEKRVFIDVTSKAVPGTATARSFALLKSARSAFTGFLSEGAAISGNSSYQYPPEQADQMTGTMTAIKPQILKVIEQDENLSNNPKAKDAVNRILDNIFAMVEETVKTGKTDSAMSVVMEGDQGPRLLMASHVAGTDKLEDTLQELATMAEQDGDFPEIKFDVDKHRSVRFHQVVIPIADAKAQKALGTDEINIFIGLSKTAMCLSAGDSSADSLKKAIDASADAGMQPVDPASFTVHVAPIVRAVASVMEQDEPEKAGQLREAVKELKGENDTLTGIGRAIKDGFAYRLELKEDVIRAIGAIVSLAQGQGLATSAP